MAKPKPASLKAPLQKAPSQKAIKSFFKLISLDLAPKVRAELEAGFDPNVQFDATGRGDQTALMYALDREKPACVRVLLDANADVKATGSEGETALHNVSDLGFVKELVERGADVNATDDRGTTPLHVACAYKRLEIAKFLLERGARVDVTDGEGKTPYASTSSAEIRALLKQRGAKGFGAGGGKTVSPTISATSWKEVELDRGAMGVDRKGNLWLGSYSGLVRFDGTTLTRYVFAETFAYDSIGAGPGDVLYIATNWGLLRFADDTFTLFSSNNSELFDNHIVYMRTSPDGRPHMLSYESEAEHKHISVFDGESFTLLSPGKEFPAALEISCLAFDDRGALVIGTDGGLAVQRDGDWKVFDTFDSEGAFPPHVYDVASSGDTLWVGTQQGLWENRGRKFVKYATPSLAKSVCVDGDSVWVGISYGGLGRLRGGELTVQKQATSALPHDDVQGLARTPDGTIWVHAGGDVARVRPNGELERMSGEPPKPPEPEKPRKLVAFAKKAIVARAKLPKPVVELIEKTKLSGLEADRLLALVRPAIAFDCIKYKTVGVGESKFGGQPDLPPGMKWPTFPSDRDRMLPFVLQFNLADVHAMDKEGLLPPKGMLYFFSDTSPDELVDARVLYTELPPAKLARRAYPEDLIDRAKEVDFVAQLPEYKIELFSLYTLPSREFLDARAELTDDDGEALHELAGKLAKLANKKLPQQCSRLLGWPDSVQEEVAETVDDIALLQLNGYELSPKGIDKVFEHWCSDGLIHFMIDAAALDKKKFDKVTASMAYT